MCGELETKVEQKGSNHTHYQLKSVSRPCDARCDYIAGQVIMSAATSLQWLEDCMG